MGNARRARAIRHGQALLTLALGAQGLSDSTITATGNLWSAENQAAQSKYATAHGLGMTQVDTLMNQAQYGSNTQKDAAWKQLQSMGVQRSTLNDLQSANSAKMAQQQGESGGFNEAMAQAANVTNAMNVLLKGPLGSFIG
jgi:hypothetical protein